jgi:hypothetical protein
MKSVESSQQQICEIELCNPGYGKTHDSHQEPGPDDVDDDPDSEKDGEHTIRFARDNKVRVFSKVDKQVGVTVRSQGRRTTRSHSHYVHVESDEEVHGAQDTEDQPCDETWNGHTA